MSDSPSLKRPRLVAPGPESGAGDGGQGAGVVTAQLRLKRGMGKRPYWWAEFKADKTKYVTNVPGISWQSQDSLWRVYVTDVNGSFVSLGRFDTFSQACDARARGAAIEKQVRRSEWRFRYDEAKKMVKSKGGELLVTPQEWIERCNRTYKPRIKCLRCKNVTSSASINNMHRGTGIGCATCVPALNRWSRRYDEVVSMIAHARGRLDCSRVAWSSECTGWDYKPLITCLACGTQIQTTTLNSLQQGNGIGCTICVSRLHLWRDRYEEALAMYAAAGHKLLVSENEWTQKCHGIRYKPRIQCGRCGDVVTSTDITNYCGGKGLNCGGCRHKTETKLFDWFLKSATHVQAQSLKFRRQCNAHYLTFDFFSPSECWIVELDGNIQGGHFDDTLGNDTPVRDLEKEQWARANGYQLIRVLQEDVWRDRLGWDNYLTTQIAEWNRRRLAGEAPRKAITPQAPEYLGGVYARLRAVQDTGPQCNGDGVCGFCDAPLGGLSMCLACGTCV